MDVETLGGSLRRGLGAHVALRMGQARRLYYLQAHFCTSSIGHIRLRSLGKLIVASGDASTASEKVSKREPLVPYLQRVTAIASSLTIIIGVIFGFVQLKNGLDQATQTLNAVKLQALQQITGILDTTSSIRIKQRALLATDLEKRIRDVKPLISDTFTGEDIYLSQEFADFREIAAHYERLGAIVFLEYLHFDIMFEIIAFPDRFWDQTRGLRQLIRENWNGPGRALPDFLSNFTKLCDKYKKGREQANKNKKIKNSGASLNCSS